MTILSDTLERAITYDVTGQIDAGDRRMHRELTVRLGNQNYQNSLLASVSEVQSVTAGDRTSGTMDLVFTLVESVGFSVLALAWNASATTVQTAVDAAAVLVVPGYVAGDIAVTGGAFGAAGSATVVTFSGTSVYGNQALLTVVGTSLAGGTTDPVASQTTAGVVPRFWFAALRGMGVLVGTNLPEVEIQTIQVIGGDTSNIKLELQIAVVGQITTGFLNANANTSLVQSRIDNACNGVIPGYVAGDIAVTGTGNLTSDPQTLTFSGDSVSGDDHSPTTASMFAQGGTLQTITLGDGGAPTTDPTFGQEPAGQYVVNLRDSLENYPSNQILRQLIKEASAQEGEDWEAELLPLLGLDRVASGIKV